MSPTFLFVTAHASLGICFNYRGKGFPSWSEPLETGYHCLYLLEINNIPANIKTWLTFWNLRNGEMNHWNLIFFFPWYKSITAITFQNNLEMVRTTFRRGSLKIFVLRMFYSVSVVQFCCFIAIPSSSSQLRGIGAAISFHCFKGGEVSLEPHALLSVP